MPLVETDAIVLHVFDYSETSRILRLATRDAGLQSVLARGARRSKSRFGSALDLFAEGAAQLQLKDGRDLQTLTSFDVTRSRAELGEDMGRFAGASSLAELVLRFSGADDVSVALFEVLADALDRLAAAQEEIAVEATLSGAWRLVAEMGFAPTIDTCASCHAAINVEGDLPFSHTAGGVLCERCARLYPGGRRLPLAARSAIAAWTEGRRLDECDSRAAKAHQRLLREFLQQHLADGRPLRAFDAWEQGALVAR
ncbi:MAG: DNA repair protein RecO [Gemmatimonadaceae bacterium]